MIVTSLWLTLPRYWPIYPKTCPTANPQRKLVDCIAAYTNDAIACGSDLYMFEAPLSSLFFYVFPRNLCILEAMVREGNDARLLSFPAPSGGGGGHSDPANEISWLAGCLGLSEVSPTALPLCCVHRCSVWELITECMVYLEACSSACETQFQSCMGSTASSSQFATCETKIKNQALPTPIRHPGTETHLTPI